MTNKEKRSNEQMLCPTVTEVLHRQWTRISPPPLLVHGNDPFSSLNPLSLAAGEDLGGEKEVFGTHEFNRLGLWANSRRLQGQCGKLLIILFFFKVRDVQLLIVVFSKTE